MNQQRMEFSEEFASKRLIHDVSKFIMENDFAGIKQNCAIVLLKLFEELTKKGIFRRVWLRKTNHDKSRFKMEHQFAGLYKCTYETYLFKY